MIDDDPNIDHEVGVHAGEPRPAWCDRCQLPSGFVVPILTMGGEGVSIIDEVSGCTDCRSGCFADAPDP